MESHELFEILVRENADMVRAFLLSSVRDPGSAEDLLQEAFLVAWKNLGKYDRKLPFGPWVRGIAGKLVLNHRRKLGRSKVYFCDDEMLGVLDRSFAEFHTLAGDTFDQKLDALRQCLTGLTDHQRASIELHYEHGLHCREISQRLEIGFEAVKKHLQRGRNALLACMRGKMSVGGVG